MAQSKFKVGANTNTSCRHIYWWLPQRSPIQQQVSLRMVWFLV